MRACFSFLADIITASEGGRSPARCVHSPGLAGFGSSESRVWAHSRSATVINEQPRAFLQAISGSELVNERQGC